MLCKLKDIAIELNVSVNTVSRALKDMPDISDALKEKINRKAVEMGYIPSMSAKFLRTGKTKTIAIVYDQFINPYYSIVTDILHKKLSAENYNLIIFTDDSGGKLSLPTVRNILSRGADGVISFLDVDAETKRLFDVRGVYVLLLGRNSFGVADSITTDDEAGGYIAAKYLVDCGHRKILMLSGPKDISCFAQRLNGFMRAVVEAGITESEYKVLTIGDDGATAAELLKSAGARFDYTAIFCYNDLLAYDVIRTLKNLRLNVPNDVSVIGYDYIESDLPLPYGLASIDTDKAQVADVASEVMLIKMENRNARAFTKVQTPRLVEGETVNKLKLAWGGGRGAGAGGGAARAGGPERMGGGNAKR
ncbi:MAG: LacI family transcriptional regulator, partial [Clostridiales bacterium]|nr:LacI family transcriptional regulator [Clostridiales bacterium]